MDYLGHTVSGRTYKKSYKSTRTHQNDRDKWIITENTHEAIINKKTWDRVQKLRESTKRKQTLTGEMGPLNGLLYCADCGRRMRIQRDQKTKFQYYVCSTYMSSRTGHRECTIHSTPRHLIEPTILDELRNMTAFAREHETDFVAQVERSFLRSTEEELRQAKSELAKATQRCAELDHIIKKIYEDNASGRLTDERFDKMYTDYEAEQSGLKDTITHLTSTIGSAQESKDSIGLFL